MKILKPYTVKEIVETGMLIATAIVLDLPGLKFRIGEGGGSISFTMVPLFVLAIRRGPIKGFIGCGIVYGAITCLIDGWGFQYFSFDYLLGYGSIGIAGFFKKPILESKSIVRGCVALTIAILVSCFGRFVFGCVSSMVFYQFEMPAAMVYNLTYIGPSTVLVLDLLLILYKPLLNINKRFPTKSIC